jgi:hypothetical protein
MEVNSQVQMVITFLSPVTPDDYVRQSLPMSYMQVSVVSIDGKSHNVELYSDISAGEFLIHVECLVMLTGARMGFG